MYRRLLASLSIIVGAAFTVFTNDVRTAEAFDPCAGGTLAYYPMTEASGTTIHDICNGYNGTWTQGVSWSSGSEGPYLQFSSGDSARISIGAPVLSQNTSITVELRMIPGSSNGTRIIGQLGPGSGQLRFVLINNADSLEVWGA